MGSPRMARGIVGEILTPVCSLLVIFPFFLPYYLGIEVERHLSKSKFNDISPLKIIDI